MPFNETLHYPWIPSSILGAQARTRWSIVGEGARSLQTQDVFYRLVSDTILKDSATQSISDMRKAIKDTNVILNLVVSPGVILLPSDLKIVKQRIAGWNNVLTTATESMSFGRNKDVNNPKTVKSSLEKSKTSSSQQKTETSSQQTEPSSKQTASEPEKNYTGTVSYVASGVLIALITRLAIFLL